MESLIFKIFEDGLFAAIAAIGFSSISNTPRRAYLWCGIIAAIGHASRSVLMMPDILGAHIVLASTLASILIGFASVLCSGKIKCPAEVCFFPALLPMIPGMYAYRTVEALVSSLANPQEELFTHYFYLFSYNGITCTFIIAGMVVGANIPVFLMKHLSFQATR